MTDTQPTYPDTREGLSALLVSCDAGFALYKSYHWAAQVRDIIGPWLDVHDTNVRAAERAELADRNLLRSEPWPPIPYPGDAVHQARWTLQRVFDAAQFRTGDRNEAFIAAAEALVAEGWSQTRETAGIELVRTEHRAVYPATIAADSDVDTRVLPEEDAHSLVANVNRKLAAAGLTESARVESRDLFATKWGARA